MHPDLRLVGKIISNINHTIQNTAILQSAADLVIFHVILEYTQNLATFNFREIHVYLIIVYILLFFMLCCVDSMDKCCVATFHAISPML